MDLLCEHRHNNDCSNWRSDAQMAESRSPQETRSLIRWRTPGPAGAAFDFPFPAHSQMSLFRAKMRSNETPAFFRHFSGTLARLVNLMVVVRGRGGFVGKFHEGGKMWTKGQWRHTFEIPTLFVFIRGKWKPLFLSDLRILEKAPILNVSRKVAETRFPETRLFLSLSFRAREVGNFSALSTTRELCDENRSSWVEKIGEISKLARFAKRRFRGRWLARACAGHVALDRFKSGAINALSHG